MKVTLDTNILHQEGYSSQNMQVIARLAEAKKIEVLVSDLVLREFDSKRMMEASAKFQSMLDNIADIKKTLAKSGMPVEGLNALEAEVKRCDDDVKGLLKKSTEDWLKVCGVTEISLGQELFASLWDSYFEGRGAFRKPKHREDIPDAAIGLCIANLASAGEKVSVVCKDGQLKGHLATCDGLNVYDELRDFIASEEVRDILKKLDSLDANVEQLKSVLEENRFQRSVMEYISEDKSDLYYACWKNEEVEDYHWLPLPLAGGIRVDGPIVESIGDVSFGAVSCVSPTHFVIPLEFVAKMPLSFAAGYGDWLQLADTQKQFFKIDSMDGDGICEFGTIKLARVVGQVVVHLLDDMNPAAVAEHASFIGHDNCKLDIEYVPGKVILLRENLPI